MNLLAEIWVPFVLVSLLSWHFLRFEVWGLPTNLWEVVVGLSFLVSLLVLKPRVLLLPVLFWFLLFLVALGLGGGFFLASDKIVAWGIIKGWFVVPLVAGWLVYRASLKGTGPVIFGFSVTLLFLSILALIQYLSGDFITLDGRASAIFSSANQLAMVLVPSWLLVAGYWWLLRGARLSPAEKIFLALGLLLGLGAIILTFSYGAFLALMAGLMGLVFLKWQSRKAGAVAVILGTLGVGLLYQKISLLALASSSSVLARLQIWRASWQMIKENFLGGVGLGDFSTQYQETISRLFAKPLELLVPHAHNFFLQTILYLGPLGFVGLVGFLIMAFGRAFRGAAWLLPSLLGLVIQGLFDTIYYHQALAAIFWIVIFLSLLKWPKDASV